MKIASLTFAALLLGAGLAAAQTETQSQPSDQPTPASQSRSGKPTQRGEKGPYTDYGQDMRDKKGTDQTFNTGATGQDVGKDQPAPAAGQDQGAATTAGTRRADGTRGTGVATGFVAAGIGLAILGLFVRRKGRRDDPYGEDEGDDDLGGRGPGSGAGTQTRM